MTNARADYFEEPEFRAVLAHLSDYLRPLMTFRYLTSWRKAEVLGLTWSNVDFPAQDIRLEPGITKNDQTRTFPFPAWRADGEGAESRTRWRAALGGDEADLGTSPSRSIEKLAQGRLVSQAACRLRSPCGSAHDFHEQARANQVSSFDLSVPTFASRSSIRSSTCTVCAVMSPPGSGVTPLK